MIKLQRCFTKLSSSKTKPTNKPIVDYTQRGQFRSPLQLKVGDILNDFQVTQRQKLLDFQIDSVVLKCRKHNTQWIHFDCQQQKNSIGFAFKCKQVPHIIKLSMEKLLQCGSNKFPIRNPIQFMTRRSFNPQNFSLATNQYMLYSYQTSLLRDHSNLMQVFMHMIFNPLLREQDFKQIIWRYSFKDSNILQIDGQAANQIKGMWNFSQMRIFDAIEREMFGRQGITKPVAITNLKYQDIVNWHKKIFNPQNLLIISHGDIHPTKLIQNYRKITQQFKWQQKGTLKSSQTISLSTSQKQTQKQHQLQQSKTIKIQHLQPNIPFILSYKLQNITSTQRILLSILSNILFDMPNSIFMNWNTPQTPYPKLYGFQGNYFNIGITLKSQNKKLQQKDFIQIQKQVRQALQNLYNKKITNLQIQQCLYHLQDQYYSKDGIKIITGILDPVYQLGIHSLQQTLNVKFLLSKLLRNYRKENIFEQLLKKYIINNPKYLRIYGKTNVQLIQDSQFEQKIRLKLQLQNLQQQQLQQINNYKPGDFLQDYRILPKIDINQYQIFQQRNPNIFQINGIPIYHKHKCDGIKFTIKYDITDIQQEDIKLLPVICQAFPWMGGKGINVQAFRTHVEMYINKIQMKFQTNRTAQGMRFFLYLNLQFSDRNAQFGFNLCNNLINDHNHNNVEMLSQRVQKRATQAYNDLSEKLFQFHGQHLGGTRSPYAMFQDPLFMSRSICGLATDILKISNPKQLLKQVAFDIKKITSKLTQKNRISILFQCKDKNLDKYKKYLQIMFNPLKQSPTKIEAIDEKQFTPSPCLKYFPNYQQEYVFQAFSVPYYKNIQQVPATLVLSAIINQNIKRLNQIGGSFLFKGSIISYIRGSRKKVLELEQYYKKIQDIDQAKRYIFQQFRRYTAADLFYTGVTAAEARIFKQAVAATDQASIQSCLQKYILQDIKEGKSSVLALGPHLGSYEPLIKKGWAVERSIQDMSLRMESESSAMPQIQMSKYINIY